MGGATLGLVLLPGLLAAGIGSLIFIGLDSLTGLGTFSLALPGLPSFGQPTVAEFGWALAIGLAAAPVGHGIAWLGRFLQTYAERRTMVFVPLAGVTVAALAIIYAEATGKATSDVLFSGQDALDPLITNAGSYSVGALVLLLVCKGLAYGVSLSSFRGGPIFPALFIGGAGGIALSHLPGLPLVAGVAMGIGAVSVVMLTLPLTSVLLVTLLMASDGRHGRHAAGDRRSRDRCPDRAPLSHAADGTRTCGQRHSHGQCRAGVNSASDTPDQLRAGSVPGRDRRHPSRDGRKQHLTLTVPPGQAWSGSEGP